MDPNETRPLRLSDLSDIKADPLPADFGRYTLQQVVGRGGMGLVYKAVHRSLKQTVALKMIRVLSQVPEEELVSRFYREIEAAGAVIHPHVARATDAGDEDGVHFLVTEFVDGLNLSALVQQSGPLQCGVACELLRQTAEGLTAIEACAMVHRDIKPSNLLLSWEGGLKIVDLGLARLCGYDGPEQMTRSGVILGTLDYLAPEQAADTRSVDIRADIYSLGATLFWLMTGQPLFPPPRYSSVTEKIRAHCDETPDLQPLYDACTGHAEQLLPVFNRMIAKDPDQRFQSPRELAAALQPLADANELKTLLRVVKNLDTQASVSAQIETATRNSQDTVRTGMPGLPQVRTWWLAAVCLLLLAVAGGGVYYAVATGSSTTSSTTSQSEPPAALASLPPWQWQNLLQNEPVELAWQSGDALTRWKYDQPTEQVTANCAGLGLLEFGITQSPGYTLQVGVLQNRWKGGTGIFFGAHPDKYMGDDVIAYQFLEIAEAVVRDKKMFTILRSVGRVLIDPRPGAFKPPLESVASSFIENIGGEQTIEIVVSQGELRSVKVNGVAHPKLVTGEINKLFTPADYRGSLGSWVHFSDATYRNARYMNIENTH